MFVAVPRCPATTARFNWIINGLDAGYRLAGHPTFERTLRPGDIVQARIISCQGNLVFSNEIQILPSPTMPNIAGARVICCGDETTTLTVQDPQENVTFRWYSATDNFTQPIPYATTTLSDIHMGQYRLVATNENNCETVAHVEITEGTLPYARLTLLTPPSDVRTREPIRFRNDATGWERAYWQFGEGTEWIESFGGVVEHEFESIQSHSVALHVISPDGCEATHSISLDVLPGLVGIFVPTAFMPSSSDIDNRELKVFGVDIAALRFSVYALDGRQLFTTNQFSNSGGRYTSQGWDGRYNGRDMPTGNYSWMVSVRLSSGEEIVRSGVATLVR